MQAVCSDADSAVCSHVFGQTLLFVPLSTLERTVTGFNSTLLSHTFPMSLVRCLE